MSPERGCEVIRPGRIGGDDDGRGSSSRGERSAEVRAGGLALGATSIALTVGSFFFVPWGWQFGILAAIAALACGGLALRYRRGDTASALIGIGLALVVVLFGVLVILIFAFTPGD
jgi:1,4-dihydroxy-2-naphthoate octaprenyltransferase